VAAAAAAFPAQLGLQLKNQKQNYFFASDVHDYACDCTWQLGQGSLFFSHHLKEEYSKNKEMQV
jgi:hypothetical protein